MSRLRVALATAAPNTGSGYVYRWYVAGSLVARWRVTIGVGD